MPKAALWNLEYGHDPKAHAKRILYYLELTGTYVAMVTEARDYIDELVKQAPGYGRRVLFKRVRPGSDQCAIIVRTEAKVEKVWSFVAGTWWFREGGGKMQPMQPLAAIIDGAVWIAAHGPVGAWVVSPRGRRWAGPVRRRLAYRGFTVRLRKVIRKHPRRMVVIGCDWNASPDTRGRWSPEWLRGKAKGVFVRPHKDTGHGEIDFFLVVGGEQAGMCVASNPRGWPGDHLNVRAVIRPNLDASPSNKPFEDPHRKPSEDPH